MTCIAIYNSYISLNFLGNKETRKPIVCLENKKYGGRIEHRLKDIKDFKENPFFFGKEEIECFVLKLKKKLESQIIHMN